MSNSDRIINRIGVWVAGNTQVTWTNHQPASSLVQWYRGTTRATAPVPPAIGPALRMVCYELPFWAAFHSGVWSQNRLWDAVHAFDGVGHGAAGAIMAALTARFSPRKTLFNPAINCLRKGDIVFFNNLGHVAVATGNRAVPNELFSLWGMNPIGIAPNTPIERTKVGTLLAQIAIGAPGLAQTVTYSRPRW